MDKERLLASLEKITDPSQVEFFVGQDKAENRFDTSLEGEEEESDPETDLAFLLYSWVSNAIFFKAMGKEKAKEGYSAFESYFSAFVEKAPAEEKEETEEEKKQALTVLDSFLIENEKLSLQDLFNRLCPLAIRVIEEENGKDAAKRAEKKKETSLNMATLFSRSLYHSCLSDVKGCDNFKIHPDMKNLGNGAFVYDGKELFLPTWRNAFTLNRYKAVVKAGIESLSDEADISNLTSIKVLYLSKDILAKIPVE